jgi:hypothetical protein
MQIVLLPSPKLLTCVSVVVASLILTFVLGAVLHLFKADPVYAQANIDNSLADRQKIGTDNILYPIDVRILFSDVQNATLDQQFITLVNRTNNNNNNNNNNSTSHGTQNNSSSIVAIANPDYALPDRYYTLRVGQNFRINSTAVQNTPESLYTKADITLVPIASPLPPSGNLSDIDPESDLIQQTPVLHLGSYQGNIHNFVIPQVTHPGYYLLYVSLYYPSLGMNVVYSTMLRIV